MSYNSMTGKFEPDTVSGITYRDTVTALQAVLAMQRRLTLELAKANEANALLTERIAELEQENERLRAENARLRAALNNRPVELDEANAALAALRAAARQTGTVLIERGILGVKT